MGGGGGGAHKTATGLVFVKSFEKKPFGHVDGSKKQRG